MKFLCVSYDYLCYKLKVGKEIRMCEKKNKLPKKTC